MDPEPKQEDLLIHRAASLEAGPDDWRHLDRLAAADRQVWHRLALTMRDESRLAHAVSHRLGAPLAPAGGISLAAHTKRSRVLPAAMAGWAAAALIAVSWCLSWWLFGASPAPADETRSPAAVAPDASFATIASELPTVMVDTRPVTNGDGFEVLCLRRTLERVHVDTLSGVGRDELGNPTTVPIDPAFVSNFEEL